MSATVLLVIAVGMLALGLLAGYALPPHGRRPARVRSDGPVRHILLPFTGQAISRRAFDAAIRLARAENAVLMPAYLAVVPLYLPLDVALPAQAEAAMRLLEAIEQRAAKRGIQVDARIARGRSYRDALQRLLDEEQFDRVIVSANGNSSAGFAGADLEWLLERVPAEILILRPAPDDTRRISASASVAGHF
jgi:nucleotide-binding universal stress UspA family protein